MVDWLCIFAYAFSPYTAKHCLHVKAIQRSVTLQQSLGVKGLNFQHNKYIMFDLQQGHEDGVCRQNNLKQLPKSWLANHGSIRCEWLAPITSKISWSNEAADRKNYKPNFFAIALYR